MDGLTVDFGDRWLNVRPSNTEPVLRLNVEAPTADDVASLVSRVRDILAETGSPSPGLLPDGLLEIMQCPRCASALEEDPAASQLVCTGCRTRYPVDNGIPNMLEDAATPPEQTP